MYIELSNSMIQLCGILLYTYYIVRMWNIGDMYTWPGLKHTLMIPDGYHPDFTQNTTFSPRLSLPHLVLQDAFLQMSHGLRSQPKNSWGKGHSSRIPCPKMTTCSTETQWRNASLRSAALRLSKCFGHSSPAGF